MINDKLYIPHPLGVRVIHYDHPAQQFISTSEFDYNSILGLDKPKSRVKARTAPTTPKNCRVGQIRKFRSVMEQAYFEMELGMLLSPEALKKFMEL